MESRQKKRKDVRSRAEDESISASEVLEAAPDALLIVDGNGRIVRLNAVTEETFGYRREELLGEPVETLVPEQYRSALGLLRADFRKHVRRRPAGHGPELYGRRSDGSEFPVEISLSPVRTGRGTMAIVAVRDISARKLVEAERNHLEHERVLYAEISRLASRDALTGLPNRMLLSDRLAGAIRAAGRRRGQLAVLFLDLDRFKQVNDSLGHGAGDRLLRVVAKRLAESVRGSDTVSRQGGDEFVVLLSELHGREDAAAVADKILAAVSEPSRIGVQELHVTASIGIAVYPDDGEDAETLLKNADIAMYYAKDRGRNDYQFFTAEMNQRVVERQALEASLHRALERREFVLYYQPKVDLETGAMIGAEALLRWQHPVHGLFEPERFVPVAEDSGLIVPIGRWVLREACRQAREWQDRGLSPVPVAVNISTVEFRSKNFLQHLRRILEETRLAPSLLELEVTESVLMEATGETARMLAEIKAMGIGLTVDDFGTGYSSLSYLLQFPIDALKVDRSFVREIRRVRDGSPIITAVISMGKSLNHRVIAEGVETLEQLAFLKQQRCEEGQGFHFSPPLEAGRFAALLGTGRGKVPSAGQDGQ